MTKQNRLYIKEDISEWRDEFYREEPRLETKEDLINLRKSKLHPSAVGRMAIAARQMGVSDSEILPPNLEIIQVGAVQAISSAIAARKKLTTLPNGMEVQLREFVADAAEEPETDEEGQPVEDVTIIPDFSIAPSDSKEGISRAEKYLMNTALGHVRGRLNILAQNPEAFKRATKDFMKKFNAMVAELS